MKLLIRRIIAIFLLFSLILIVGYFRNHIFNAREVRGSQIFLSEIVQTDSPSKTWLENYDKSNDVTGVEGFYFFKTFFASEGVTSFDLKTAYCPVLSEDEYGVYLNLSYGKELPEISVRIREVDNDLLYFPHFSLNNCLFSPDYNRDGFIDSLDVNLAKLEYQDANH